MATFEVLTSSNVLGGGGGGSSYLVASVELTDAQIKALPTTPIQLVAAQGAGKAIYILNANAVQKIVSNGFYTNITATEFLLTTQSNDNSVFIVDANALQEVTGTWFCQGVVNSFSYSNLMDNQPVRILMDNSGGGNFTGGNAANTLKVTVYYVVVDL